MDYLVEIIIACFGLGEKGLKAAMEARLIADWDGSLYVTCKGFEWIKVHSRRVWLTKPIAFIQVLIHRARYW